MISPPPIVLFFDGVCGLCNRSVDLLFRIDGRGTVKVAALQSNYASRILPQALVDAPSSLVVRLATGQILTKTRAVLAILLAVGGPWRLLAGILWLVPRPIADWLYDGIAASRYAWFGKKETCRLPTPEERARFIDDHSSLPATDASIAA